MTNMKLDFDKLTMGDLCDIEEHTGKSWDKIVEPKFVRDDEGNKVPDEDGRPLMVIKPTMKEVLVLVWICLRQQDPNATLEDAKKVRLTEFELDLGQDEGPKDGDEKSEKE